MRTAPTRRSPSAARNSAATIAPAVAACRSRPARSAACPAAAPRSRPARRSRPMRLEEPPPRRIAGGAQPRRALPPQRARHLRHARRRRARARRIGKDMQKGEAALLDQRAASSSNIASLSVGKPAIRSAPNTMSGRAARSRGAEPIASARLCRRFIRFRIRSSPACSDRCRCGISRGSLPISRHELVVDLDRIERGEPQPRQLRHLRQQPPHHLAERSAARQVARHRR